MRGEIILYQSGDGSSAIDVHLKDETVWLSLNQMAALFERDNFVISRHLRNIFQTGELVKDETVAKNATVQTEGGRQVTRHIEWYNLDVIISVGYRVNSQRGTQFRIWGTSVLKDHLVERYTPNQRRLAEKGAGEMRQVLSLLANTLEFHKLVNDEGRAVLNIVNRYARTWQLLLQYDEDNFPVPKKRHDLQKNSYEFIFQLSREERDEVITICDDLKPLKFAWTVFFVFTGHGDVVQHSEQRKSNWVNIVILHVFVQMRQILSTHEGLKRKTEAEN